MDGDPWSNFVSANDKGALVNGKVKSVDAKGAVIALSDDVEGYLRASEISRDRVQDASTLLKEGDDVEAVIINVDRKNRNINLSVKAKDNVEEREALQRNTADAGNAATGTTNLGALLKAKMDQK
jgi:small subunit ribosomal protein S1